MSGMDLSKRRRHMGVCLMILLWVLPSCDEVKVRETNLSQILPKADHALLATLSTKGLETLLAAPLAEGLRIEAPQQGVPTLSALNDLRLGPLDQQIKVQLPTAQLGSGTFDVDMTIQDALVLVPTRQGQFDQTQLCRWRVQIPRVTIGLSLAQANDEANRLQVVGQPQVDLSEARVDSIGQCGLEARLSQDDTLETLKQAMITYVQQAIIDSVREVVRIRPLEATGLVQGGLEVTRQSNFSNRRGQLLIEGEFDQDRGLGITPEGLSVHMRYGAQVGTPAACTPPIEIGSIALEPRQPIDPAQLDQFKADVALAMPTQLIEQLLRATIRSGFMCRGLDDLGLATEQSIAKQDLLLDTIGVDTTLIGQQTYLSFSPGTLPTLTSMPEQGLVDIQWDDLTFALYGKVLGAVTRILDMRVSVNFRARIATLTNQALTFKIETVTLQKTALESPWMTQPASDSEATLWAKRLVLLAFGEGFVLPLPLKPDTQATILGTTLRQRDVVFFLNLESE